LSRRHVGLQFGKLCQALADRVQLPCKLRLPFLNLTLGAQHASERFYFRAAKRDPLAPFKRREFRRFRVIDRRRRARVLPASKPTHR
jgi:hypothetical protein